MATYEHSIDVERPVRVVYDQWTQMESYPQFMDDVESVTQTRDDLNHWVVNIGGVRREYDAKIVRQQPDDVVQWTTTEGPDQGGTVSFNPLGPDLTRVTLRMDFEPHGITETAGNMLGIVEGSVEKSLVNFKEFIESRDEATGAWRGRIEEGSGIGGAAGSRPVPPRMGTQDGTSAEGSSATGIAGDDL